MKFSCGPSWKAKFDAKHEWHLFFALWPRRVAENDCRWFETIERKGHYQHCWGHGDWIWKYRALA